MDGPTPQHARNAIALTGIPENPVNTEAPPNPPTSDIVKISFWQKFFQRLSSHF
ncbi:hypothetical protein AGABI2DRAFT_192146 [Agaricus bisporus var. bisporus H97]|uniref:hypothetical protein n=1 Tax=Agaricus bisporus var. bisporus (strain H97 / ATCC MYA-4626 / FGSC 10389) TaxID=936046 RepID=UPI00029F6F47|nr:hypothetical protein AGABI2DRAFT_192146 [Agaricus bisporus var. bisporus H97]EKV48577.1 hypothetical protein AGABI2DRAFT_192146 [Agaricus bisporus var. bisporus H97]